MRDVEVMGQPPRLRGRYSSARRPTMGPTNLLRPILLPNDAEDRSKRGNHTARPQRDYNANRCGIAATCLNPLLTPSDAGNADAGNNAAAIAQPPSNADTSRAIIAALGTSLGGSLQTNNAPL